MRGNDTPAIAYDRCTSPEQSYVSGPVAPHTYGFPTWANAYLMATLTACGAASGQLPAERAGRARPAR